MVSSTIPGPAAHPFAPPCGGAAALPALFATARAIPAKPSSSSFRSPQRPLPSRGGWRGGARASGAAGTTALPDCRDQAEGYLAEHHPRFCDLLRSNPAALDRMRDSASGYAVFAPSERAFDSLGHGRLGLLAAAMAGRDPELRSASDAMAEYHMVSAPATAGIMAAYGVVTTSLGEMPVEVAPDGTMYVNGVRVVRSYQFEDRSVVDYRDGGGNPLGIEEVVPGGGADKRCVVHEVEGLLCPDELWQVMQAHYMQSAGSGAM